MSSPRARAARSLLGVSAPPVTWPLADVMLSVQEVAEQLRCSQALVYGLCAKGRLPHYRIGMGRGAIRILDEDLAAFLECCRSEQQTKSASELKHIKKPST